MFINQKRFAVGCHIGLIGHGVVRCGILAGNDAHVGQFGLDRSNVVRHIRSIAIARTVTLNAWHLANDDINVAWRTTGQDRVALIVAKQKIAIGIDDFGFHRIAVLGFDIIKIIGQDENHRRICHRLAQRCDFHRWRVSARDIKQPHNKEGIVRRKCDPFTVTDRSGDAVAW